MGAVRGAESVVDVQVRQAGHGAGQLFVVLLFTRVEAGIFQDQHLTGLQGRGGLHGAAADSVLGELDRRFDERTQVFGHRAEREFGFRPVLRPAQMRRQDHRRPVVQQVLDGRQRGADAGIISHLAVFDGHIEVHPNQDSS